MAKIIRRKFKSEQSFGVIPILHEDGKNYYLLIQLANMEHWAFPKGHKDDLLESDVDSARRELKEETGIDEVRIDESKTFEEKYFYRKGEELIGKVATYFIGFVIDRRVVLQKEEVMNYLWVSEEEVLNKITYPATKKMFQEVVDYLKEKRALPKHT